MAPGPSIDTAAERRRALWARAFWVFAAAAAGFIGFLVSEGVPEAGRFTLGLFLVAAVLWVTEAVPLFITSFVVLFLEVVLLAMPGRPLAELGYQIYVWPFFDPTIVLFLGGFALGVALNRYRVDEVIVAFILKRVPATPAGVLGGMMFTTALISMWMSNTATAALMMAVALPIVRRLPPDEPFRKGLLLAIPFAANLGGMGTPVGTPPNAIAIGALGRAGIWVTFLDWMAVAVPVMAVLLAVCWLLLMKVYPARQKEMRISVALPERISWQAWFVMGVFTMTALAWFTAPWHKVPEGIVGLIPVILFFGTRVLSADDFRDLGWDVLMVFGGGLSLGVAIQRSGLSSWAVSLVDLEGMALWMAVLVAGGAAVLISNFMSNTASAALLVPLAVGVGGAAMAPLAIAVALGASGAMALPISTPPNVIAFASRELAVVDMLRVGALIGVLTVALVVGVALVVW